MVDIRNPKGLHTPEQVGRALAMAAGVVKLVTGVANNASYVVMMDALDKLKQHPRYKHAVKKAFNDCLKEWQRYESRLQNPADGDMRFFHVDDMDADTRKKYGNITDKEYYEFWTGYGAYGYTKTEHIITSLRNKYRLSIERQGIKHADILQYGLVAGACLVLAMKMYEVAIQNCWDQYGIPDNIARHVFDPFDIGPLVKRWDRALDLIMPEYNDAQPDPMDERNIQLGLEQLVELWGSTDTLYDSVSDATEDYSEIWRTKGEMKKALRHIADVKNETNVELKKQKTL